MILCYLGMCIKILWSGQRRSNEQIELAFALFRVETDTDNEISMNNNIASPVAASTKPSNVNQAQKIDYR